MTTIVSILGVTFFVIIPVVSFLFPLVKKTWGIGVFWVIMVFWLVPPYPLGYIIAHSYPNNGYATAIGSGLVGLFCALLWFFIFPIVIFIVAKISPKEKDNQINQKFQSETNEVFKPRKPGETFFHISDIWKS